MRLLLALALALALAPAAHADPPWSAPAPVPGAPDAFPLLDFAPGGSGLIAYDESRMGRATIRTRAFAAPVLAGTPGPARQLAADLSLVRVALYGQGRVLAVGGPGEQRAGGPQDLRAAVGRVGSPLGRPRVLLRGPRTAVPAHRALHPVGLGANDAGDAGVLAGRCATTGCAATVPVLIPKPRRAGFGRPVALGGRGRLRAAEVAVNARGDLLAAWVLDGVVHARLRSAGGRLGPLRRLGRAVGFPVLSAGLGPGGRAVVAWGSQRVSEGEPLGPFVARAALARARGAFRPARTLETVPASGTGTYVSGAGVATSVLRTGRIGVAWTGRERGRFVTRVADAFAARLDPRSAQIVSPPAVDSVLAGLATGPRGDAVVLSATGIRGRDSAPGQSQGLAAAARAETATRFGAPEAVWSGTVDPAGGVRLAVDPASGRALAVWRTVSGPLHFAVRPSPSS